MQQESEMSVKKKKQPSFFLFSYAHTVRLFRELNIWPELVITIGQLMITPAYAQTAQTTKQKLSVQNQLKKRKMYCVYL